MVRGLRSEMVFLRFNSFLSLLRARLMPFTCPVVHLGLTPVFLKRRKRIFGFENWWQKRNAFHRTGWKIVPSDLILNFFKSMILLRIFISIRLFLRVVGCLSQSQSHGGEDFSNAISLTWGRGRGKGGERMNWSFPYPTWLWWLTVGRERFMVCMA